MLAKDQFERIRKVVVEVYFKAQCLIIWLAGAKHRTDCVQDEKRASEYEAGVTDIDSTAMHTFSFCFLPSGSINAGKFLSGCTTNRLSSNAQLH